MASRRAVPVSPGASADTLSPVSPINSEPSNTAPAVPLPVILKLLGFTFAMVTAPIGTYFVVNSAFGNSTAAGASAAVVANVVLIGYVIVAYQEDQSDRAEEERKAKKSD